MITPAAVAGRLALITFLGYSLCTLAAGSGLSWDQCSSASQCNESYECLTLNNVTEGWEQCLQFDSDVCYCIDIVHSTCNDSSDCNQGEQCGFLNPGETTKSLCISCETVKRRESTPVGDDICGKAGTGDGNGTDTSDKVCIAASSLSHLSSKDLVFESHRQAAVLCDGHGSCATPGHIVMHNGRAVMMKTYCDDIGSCRRRVMLVNSPRMKRGLRIPSRTDGLAFTALAARYESRTEETVLAALVHMGA